MWSSLKALSPSRRLAAGVLLCLGALLALGWGFADRVKQREAYLAECGAGGDCPHRRVFLALVEIIERDEDSLVVLKQARRIRLYNTPSDLRPGDTISVIAQFDETGHLQVQDLERHPLRPLKKGLGVLGLALCGGLCLWGLRLESGRLVERG